MPLGVVTVTSAMPAPAGEVAVICVGLTTEKLAAGVAPKLTALAPVKSVPVIVTLVPPAAGPDDGLTPVTVGGGTNVNRSAELVALVPPGVVTLTSCAPALPAGETAMICVAETGVTTAAFDPPNLTALGLSRFVPVIVTAVPPSVGPEVGLTPVTVGRSGVRVLVGLAGRAGAARRRDGHVDCSGRARPARWRRSASRCCC